MKISLASARARSLFLTLVLLDAAGLIFEAGKAWLAAQYAASLNPDAWLRAAELEPGNAQYWHRLGLLEEWDFGQSDPHQAIVYLRRATEINPRSDMDWMDLAGAYESLGETARARATDSLRTCEDVRELCRILADTLRPIGFDGFSFKLPFTAWFPDPFSAPLSRDPSGALVCRWTADGSLGPTWELKLELMNSAGSKCGFFAIYKRLTGEPLLVDINLLTDGFHAALADAVHRLIIKTGVAVREYEQVESSLKVRAASASSSD